MRTIYHNIGSIQTMSDTSPLIEGKSIIVKGNVIEDIKDSVEEFESSDCSFVDVGGKAIIPGFIDAHNHLLWAGDRFNEHNLRLEGKTYSEIANMGGGIMETVRQTRNVTSKSLYLIGLQRLMESLKNGTTHVEAKSGYGLSTEHEVRLLAIVDQLKQQQGVPSIHSTWMGAHAKTPEHTYQSYTEEILADQLPNVLESGLAESADVFCEPGWFSVEQ